MEETIKIIPSKSDSFVVSEGQKTLDLIKRLGNLDKDEKENLLSETKAILSNCINPINTVNSITGIAVGYVQSGKTMSFTTLSAMAIDNGFRIIIYFAGNKNNLLEQTTKRLKKDLLTDGENARDYKVWQNPTVKDGVHFNIKNALALNHKPTVLITVLKSHVHIDALTAIFTTHEVRDSLRNNGVLIIDEEADQASLNTYARKNSKAEDWEDDEVSTTYSSILNLKAALPNHSYIQYTATPQGPLLINLMDLLSPKFHVVLTPGKAYTGGKAFFQENTDLIISIPDDEVYHHKKNQLTECPESLVRALHLFLMGVAITVNIQKKEKFLSMMVHAASEKGASRKFNNWITERLDIWSKRLQLPDNDPSNIELLNEFKENYKEAVRRIVSPPSFNEVVKEVLQVILDTNIKLVISGEKEINWSNDPSHILVGADMLNRGFTVEGLAVSYMPRYSIGKSNADTIQQRCRFFGYKLNYLDSCRVFLPNESIIEYCEYLDHEEIMRNGLKENTLRELEQMLIMGSDINPTRNNILSVDLVRHKLSGWRQMNALQHIDENKIFVEAFLNLHSFTNFKTYNTVDRTHRYVKLEIVKVIEFLKDFKISNMPDTLRKSSTIQYLRYLSDQQQITHAYIFEMSYGIIEGRERSLENEGGKMKINNIFSGRSLTGSETYPGDKGICFPDSLCIQIHKVKLKHNTAAWYKKMIYTLGIYYPEGFAHTFVGIEK